MEVIGAAYEDMQAKNARLLQQLAEKDAQNNQVLTEKIQIQHQVAARAEQQQQAEAARKLAEQQVQALQERIAALESKLQVSPMIPRIPDTLCSSPELEGLHDENLNGTLHWAGSKTK